MNSLLLWRPHLYSCRFDIKRRRASDIAQVAVPPVSI
ncbi:unnamed protein product [Haemonchus placei]|uniref:Uncharacterized protein n=1 Tax=Haemonchus placei TaxID=6290 RepID=A0A0N4X683_HAEPC|nr:unnamed protein product [Haemonchus placei]